MQENNETEARKIASLYGEALGLGDAALIHDDQAELRNC